MTRVKTGSRMFYRVTSSNGSGIYGGECPTLTAALNLAESVAERWVGFGPFELEQVIEFRDGSRRYFMREGSQWVLWDALRDVDERAPDWLFGADSDRSTEEGRHDG